MNQRSSPRLRAGWLGVATLAFLVGLVGSGFDLPVLFDLTGRDYAQWVEHFSTGVGEAVVRVQGREGRVPYLLPGPQDVWAGGEPNRIHVHFPGASDGDRLLHLSVRDSHDRLPPHLTVSIDGREVGRIRVSAGLGLPPPHEGAGPARAYRLRIPAAAFDHSGEHTLTVTNGEGSWVALSRLALFSSSRTFLPAHYFERSPPPRWALVALGGGLFALWAAGTLRGRDRVLSLFVLGTSLAFLGFLELGSVRVTGDWRVILATRRATWLLLVLGFAVALGPGVPRVTLSRLLTLTAFVTGALVMLFELVGFRLLSPFFGYSVYVWGSLLGVVMGALAIGYYLGGRLADRWPSLTVLYSALLVTAVATLIVRFAYPSIVRLTAQLPLVSGSLLAALLLLLLPMVGLSLTPPFVIRALAASGKVGIAAGRIYAVSTVGSIIGTFVSAFLLITTLGPKAAWVAGGVLLLVLSGYGLLHSHGRGTVVGIQALGVLLVFTQPWMPEISVAALKGGVRLYEGESDYSHLEVIQVGRTLQLVPQLRFVHTIYDEERLFDPMISYGLVPSFLTRSRTMLHLGMGGGLLARLYLRVHPELRVDGVDIDAEMVRLGRRFFGLPEDPRLRVFIEDARAYLRRTPDARYDVIVWDLFQGGVFVPHYTLTREFFVLVRERLAEGGVLAAFIAKPRPFDSVLRRERYQRLFAAVGNTLTDVFRSVFFFPVGRIGYFFVATHERVSAEAVRRQLMRVDVPEVRRLARIAVEGLEEYQPRAGTPVLTDDLAPVDQLIYDAFFRR